MSGGSGQYECGAGSGFLVLDVVFEGQSLNYDQSAGGNVQQLKKIHLGGRVHTMVSRYALRYSILEAGQRLFGWRLADREALILSGSGENKVIQPNPHKLCSVLDYVDLDLFGFLVTGIPRGGSEEKKKNKEEEQTITVARPSPVKISHAISMEPYKFDSHFNVNLGLAKRAGTLGEVQNPFQLEEHRSYYIYTIVVDLCSIGLQKAIIGEAGENVPEQFKSCSEDANGMIFYVVKRNPEDERKRVLELVASVMSLVRNIKGRAEDLSPRLMVAAYYPKIYRSYAGMIRLLQDSSRETVISEGVDEKGNKIYRVTESSWEGASFRLLELPATETWLAYRRSGVSVAGPDGSALSCVTSTKEALKSIAEWIGAEAEPVIKSL